MSARTFVLSAVLVGCAHHVAESAPHSAPVVTPTAKLAIAAPPERFPTFHVVARGFPGSDKRPSPMRLCPIDNAIFVCGGDLMIMLRGRDLVADDALLNGLPRDERGRVDGRIDSVEGQFPGDAWVRVLQRRSGEFEYSYYRYKNGAWAHAFTPPASARSPAYSLTRVRGGDKPLFQVSDLERPVRFFAPNGGTRPRDGLFCGQGGLLSVHDDGELLTYGASSCSSGAHELRRWSPSGKSERVSLPNLPTFSFAFFGEQMFGFGGDDAAPHLSRREGKAWVAMNTAGITGAIYSYDRFGQVEWASTLDALYRRAEGTGFTRYELPSDRKSMWITGDNDVWILQTETRDGVLLRTIAPTNEARFGWK